MIIASPVRTGERTLVLPAKSRTPRNRYDSRSLRKGTLQPDRLCSASTRASLRSSTSLATAEPDQRSLSIPDRSVRPSRERKASAEAPSPPTPVARLFFASLQGRALLLMTSGRSAERRFNAVFYHQSPEATDSPHKGKNFEATKWRCRRSGRNKRLNHHISCAWGAQGRVETLASLPPYGPMEIQTTQKQLSAGIR